jgi:hypothetical protein
LSRVRFWAGNLGLTAHWRIWCWRRSIPRVFVMNWAFRFISLPNSAIINYHSGGREF